MGRGEHNTAPALRSAEARLDSPPSPPTPKNERMGGAASLTGLEREEGRGRRRRRQHHHGDKEGRD